MRKRIIVLMLVALTVAGAAAIGAGGCNSGASGTVTASGSTTVLPIAQEAADQFMQENPGATVTVQGGGSSVGIKNVADGVSDIGDASRELKDEEESLGLVDNKIALDIIVGIVNPDVTVDNLTIAQMKDVFTGKITNWSEVGGADAPIVVVVRDEASGTREMFDEKVLETSKDNPVKPVSGAIEANSNGVLRQKVASTSNSIGYISSGYVDKTIKALELDGVEGTVENALNDSYPLSRYLHMFTKGEATGTVKDFIDFVLSEEFQTETVSKEYIPITEVPEGSE
jgi:phosphate transport system substrate-binding protein